MAAVCLFLSPCTTYPAGKSLTIWFKHSFGFCGTVDKDIPVISAVQNQQVVPLKMSFL